MFCSGNHERTWENSGSIYNGRDSGGECGVPAETLYYVPAENRAKFWYAIHVKHTFLLLVVIICGKIIRALSRGKKRNFKHKLILVQS